MDTVRSLVEDKPVVIFSKNSCCISHSIKQLITSYGANPTIYELDELPNGREIDRALQKLRCKPGVPAVFIGQKLVGGANDVISLQVQGKLVPMLMDAAPKLHPTLASRDNSAVVTAFMETVRHLIEEKPVVIFSGSSCCISYSMIQLISSYGANPSVYELDELPNGYEIDKALQKLGCKPTVPAVFIGKDSLPGLIMSSASKCNGSLYQ
ncbi:hypothetical protein Cgig2_002611 [Carnegiea gigantea]|uniref:Glutaredoxin domain-containing protein n=1 Tax=Carnegiea gigantea TaxID=171969 RepID=A0A9Q1K0R7_9CARY|nr:hypothetical protein Cgig2_002611 [Carnegiea gigantea]